MKGDDVVVLTSEPQHSTLLAQVKRLLHGSEKFSAGQG